MLTNFLRQVSTSGLRIVSRATVGTLLLLALLSSCNKEDNVIVGCPSASLTRDAQGDCVCDQAAGWIPAYDGRTCGNVKEFGDYLWWKIYFVDSVPFLEFDTLLFRFASDRDTAAFGHGTHASIAGFAGIGRQRANGKTYSTPFPDRCIEKAEYGFYDSLHARTMEFSIFMSPQIGFDPRMPTGTTFRFSGQLTDIDGDCRGEINRYFGTVTGDRIDGVMAVWDRPDDRYADLVKVGEFRWQAIRLPQPYRPSGNSIF